MSATNDILLQILPFLDKHHALGLLSYYRESDPSLGEAFEKVMATTALLPDFNVKPAHENKIQATTDIAQPALNMFFEKVEGDDIYTYRFSLSASEVEQMRAAGELSPDHLETKGITRAVMKAVMDLAYLYYDKCSYGDATELLQLCQSVIGYDLPTEPIQWGKLICDTLATNWQSATSVAEQIRRSQNSDGQEGFRFTQADTTVRARAWLLHWVLFPFFKGGAQYPVNVLYYIFDRTNDVYQRVVETVCPHYLRYICAASLLNRNRTANFRSTAQMAEEVYEYSDALTKLVTLINKPSLNEAIALLPEVRDVIRSDYFLMDLEEDIVRSAKEMIFLRYVNLHAVVSIPHIAKQMDMTVAEAEVWLVNLVSDSKQRVKVDSVNEQLNVESNARSVEAKVFDKLHSVSQRW